MIQIGIEIVASVIACSWAYKFAECLRGLAKVPNLAVQDGISGFPSQSLVAIVPARNEEKSIRACIQSLVNQDYPELQVIAVDDRSEDGTGVILDELAQQFRGRLKVVHVKRLPSGWLGKSHAMAVAAKSVLGRCPPDWLLFTDADVEFHPSIISRSLAEAIPHEVEHLVVMPTTLAKTFGEALVLSFMHVMSLWALRPWQVANPRAKRDTVGVGAFNLIRTSAYLQIGGFEAFPMEILEDLRLGREVKAAGLRQQVATAPGMVNVHWASGVTGIVQGITKNLFAVFNFRVAWLTLAAVWIAMFCTAPLVFLFFWQTRIQGGLIVLSVIGLYRLSSRTSRISPWFSVLLPVSSLIVIYAMLRSMIVTLVRGGVKWRGTFYDLDELRRYRQRTGSSAVGTPGPQ